MKNIGKNVLIFAFLLALCSCGKSQKITIWSGDKVIAAGGGIATWTTQDSDSYWTPIFEAVLFQTELTSESKVIDSQLIEAPGSHFVGEWCEVLGKNGQIVLDFKPNTTPYTRFVTVYFDYQGYCFKVKQEANSQND